MIKIAPFCGARLKLGVSSCCHWLRPSGAGLAPNLGRFAAVKKPPKPLQRAKGF